jgi:GTP-binding protein EngB required for normal cell division
MYAWYCVVYFFDEILKVLKNYKRQINLFEKENIKYMFVANKADKGLEENKFSQKKIFST